MSNEITITEDFSMKVMSDEGMFYRVNQMADMMAKSLAIPQHLRGDHGACFNVVLQAMQWKMNPFAVCQKTHSIKGNVGYEAQLINAVINAHAPIKAPLDYEFFGPWENIMGKFDVMTNESGKQYNKSTMDKEAEKGCGVRAWATLKGEDKPRVIELFMAQCPVRNSTNWANDPQQQLIYMAQKKWARRYCPEIILGVYSADEMPSQPLKKSEPQKQVVANDPLTQAMQQQSEPVEVVAEVVESEVTTIKMVVDAIGLQEQDITMYFKAVTGDWGIKESLSELSEEQRSVIIADPRNVISAIQNFKNQA